MVAMQGAHAGVRRYTDRDLPVRVRAQLLEGMAREWPWVFTDPWALRPDTLPAAVRPTYFAVVERDRLLASAMVLRLDLEHLGERFAVDGLGNVRVAPEARGRGLGSAVVEAATDFVRVGDADVAALFCIRERTAFYARFGWEIVEGAVTLRGDRQRPEVYPAIRMMLFLSERGRATRERFATEPWYVGRTW